MSVVVWRRNRSSKTPLRLHTSHRVSSNFCLASQGSVTSAMIRYTADLTCGRFRLKDAKPR